LVKPQFKVTVVGRHGLRLRLGRERYALDLLEKVDAARVEEASVLFLSRRGGFVYLLLDVCGLSKAKPDDRQCGAGTECNLVWLKLDARRLVADSKSVRFESCWRPITSDEGYRISGHTLTLEFGDLSERINYKATYDADRPEEGIRVDEKPAPPR
jgi:hypothetical protein